MVKLNINFLIKASVENILKNIDYYFYELIQEIESYLNLDAIYKVNFLLEYEESNVLDQSDDVLSMGVERFYNDDILTIKVFSNFFQYIHFVMLREAYNCFIPISAKGIKVIDIFINQKLIIDLQKLKLSKEWNSLIRDKIVNYEFIRGEFDRLENFLKRDSESMSIDSPFIFFFKYVRKNIQIIVEKEQNFYDIFFKEFLLISSKSLYNDDEIIETIRVLNLIFKKVKYYSAMLDYQDYFVLFKEQGVIKTNLSLNRFTENMQWIKNFSSISPSYHVNWPALNILSVNCIIKFNPVIKRSKIIRFADELPFFVVLKESRNSFGIEIEGYFMIPRIYYKDLKTFLEKCRNNGYFLEVRLNVLEKARTFLNLNYFREYLNKKTLVNTNHELYDKSFELTFSLIYAKEVIMPRLSLLDWLIIDRVRYFSQTGFNFERRAGALKILKTDLINEIISQRKFISNLKTNLLIIHSSIKLRNKFIDFLKSNESFGLFYIKNMLNDYIISFNLLKEILIRNPSINSIHKFNDYLKDQGISPSVENNIKFNNPSIKKVFFNHFLPLYFKSREKFEEEINKYMNFYNVICSCFDLKIFNLQSIRMIVKDSSLINTIYKSKEEKLINSYEKYETSEITYHVVEQRLESFINCEPPLIKPELSRTLLVTDTQLFIILLKNNEESLKTLENITFICKKGSIVSGEMLNVMFLIPYLNQDEKRTFISILHRLFKGNLISVKRYLWSNLQQAFSLKFFYDLDQKKFFYTKDLFEQFFRNVRSILGEVEKPLPELQKMMPKRFWSGEHDVSSLIKKVEDRIRKETLEFSSENLQSLNKYHDLLNENILNIEDFKESQEHFFFKNYIKSIDFIPNFQKFGLGQYYLYFYPTDVENVDFKIMLNNAFQTISYPAQIDNSNSFLIQYIYPYRNPGIIKYMNWLVKSKKTIREYCLFFIKRFHQNFHLNYNLRSKGWDLDPNRFKIYFQNIMFNPDYKVQIPHLKQFNIGDLKSSDYFSPNSSEFKALSHIYSWKSLDIKSYLTRRYFKINKSIMDLLTNELIQPFLTLTNLNLVEELVIILPNVEKKYNEPILKIFSFFNISFIYEIEGEYYIHGFEDVIKFENGFMIKLYFPECQIEEFENLFDLIFELMEIDNYLVLTDLIEGKTLIKSIFRGLRFLDSYNPLTNLIWNEKDKRWQNHKLFNENFEPTYPDLFYGKKNYDLEP